MGFLNMQDQWKSVLVGAVALGFTFSLDARADSASSLTWGNVTFSLSDLGGGELQLTIDNALNANNSNGAGWAGIQYLEAFALKPNGGNYNSASVVNVTGWKFESGGLSNSSSVGCNGSGTGFVCFDYGVVNPPFPPNYPTPYPLSNHMVFDVQFAGPPGFTVDLSSVDLKVDFWTSPSHNCLQVGTNWVCAKTGDQLSQVIDPSPPAAVPGPIVGAGLPGLVMACGGLVVLARRRRQKIA
jgi:hypothetical protein